MKKTRKNQENPIYRTGPTTQPKGYGGFVAVLLVLVILFGGSASVLGILNIRLLETLPLPQRQETTISFAPADHNAATGQTAPLSAQYTEFSALGLSVESVTTFLQLYYDLPPGAYITAVAEGSGAEAAGCLPGDIIVEAGGVSVTDAQTLLDLLAECKKGQEVVLTLYRAGQTHAIRLIVD